MSLFDNLKKQKLLSFALLVFTLAIGIVIGTLMNTHVSAARDQVAAPDATPLVIPSAKPLSNEFSKIAEALEPSVVNISTDYAPKAMAKDRKGAPDSDEDEDDDSSDLFHRFFRQQPNGKQQPMPRAFRRQATGSGFIVDRNGYILTNNHVVEDADHIKVKMPEDKTEYSAKLIGIDTETDLAVIKIDVGKTLSPVKIGNSDAVRPGDWAIAIGSPFGLEATITAGIVSATGRDIEGAQQFQRFIQTDAAINPGNSGGPLLNVNGEVIGINTAIATRSGGYQGVGFALPINSAVAVYNSIIRTGKMSRGSIGIRFNKFPNPGEVLGALNIKGGVLVESVTAGGPAEKAGLKQDDVITSFNGKPVKDGDELVAQVSQAPIGSDATVVVDRDGKKREFKVTIGNREDQVRAAGKPLLPPMPKAEPEPAPKPIQPTSAKFGISIRNATDDERTAAQITDKRGVVITQVQEGSFADEIGLQERDMIVSINRAPVASLEEVRKLQTEMKPGTPVLFRIWRPMPALVKGGKQQYTTIVLSGTLPR